jgi:transposase
LGIFEDLMQTKLTTAERVSLVFIYARMNESYRNAAAEFNHQHPHRSAVDHSTLRRLIDRFKETGRVDDLPRCGRPVTATTEASSTAVLATISRSPKKSIRKLSQETGISRASISRILHQNNFLPYKVHLTQELHGDDMDRRMQFCEWFKQQEDPSTWIIFSDEAIFHLSGHVNRHNARYWADENPHWMDAAHIQSDPRVMVWAAIWHHKIIGPYFYEGNVTGETYLNMLPAFLEPVLEDIPLAQATKMFFQQDGAPPHFSLKVREYLNGTFTNR